MKLLLNEINILLKEHREVVAYLFFGVLTTVIGIALYEFFTKIFAISYLVATAMSWVLSVLFAYFTNRKWVFQQKSDSPWKECFSFYLSRLTTLCLEMGLMYLFVGLLHYNDSLVKIGSTVLVIILNYLFSKLFVFKKH